MLSGVGVSELVLLFVIGLLILGPERLPRVASQLGRWVGKARRTANQLRFQMEREIALADIESKQSKKRENSSQPKPGEDISKTTGADAQQDATGSGAGAGQAEPGDTAASAASGTDDAAGSEPKSSTDRQA